MSSRNRRWIFHLASMACGVALCGCAALYGNAPGEFDDYLAKASTRRLDIGDCLAQCPATPQSQGSAEGKAGDAIAAALAAGMGWSPNPCATDCSRRP